MAVKLEWVNLNGWMRRVEDGPMPFEDIAMKRGNFGPHADKIKIVDFKEPARPFALPARLTQEQDAKRRARR